MNLSGELSDWPVADLLNMLRVTSKTVTLNVRGERSGVIHFVAGRVSGASVTGDVVVEGEAGSRVAVVDALFVLAGMTRGSFELVTYQGPDAEGWEIEELLADMARLADLETDVSRSGLVEGRLMLKDALSGPVTIAEDDWWAVASLVSVLSLEQLEEVFGRARAVRLLHTLWRLDLVEPLTEDESIPPSPVLAEAPASTDSGDAVALDDASEATPATSLAPSDEAWLDEIASNAVPAAVVDSSEMPAEVESSDDPSRRAVTGVSAPASTVLTGSVLDEMRRLRSRVGE
jgi:hypothetical protein